MDLDEEGSCCSYGRGQKRPAVSAGFAGLGDDDVSPMTPPGRRFFEGSGGPHEGDVAVAERADGFLGGNPKSETHDGDSLFQQQFDLIVKLTHMGLAGFVLTKVGQD
jgi:hypothetical protein